jgi:hypothetical protein
MTCDGEQTIIGIAFILVLIFILLLAIFAGVRNGVNPCKNGLSSECGIRDMDKLCFENQYTAPVCKRYCRQLAVSSRLAGEETSVCDSEFCNNPNIDSKIALFCQSKGVERNWPKRNLFKRTRRRS